jgi:SMC interacting uncharacterized protein involved in chromosome segregation
MTAVLPLALLLPSVVYFWHAAMGLLHWIVLLVVSYTICMPLCCSFRAKRHDGQHGCLTTTTRSREKSNTF